MADSETGNTREGYIFNGRFGTDLQVILPNQEFLEVALETIPMMKYHTPPEECFAQCHLQVSGGNGGYLAVLRPLSAGKIPLNAEAIW